MRTAGGRLVLLAAGGTGGHMFPAQALAHELLTRDCGVAVVTDRRGGGYGEGAADLPTHQVRAGRITGRGPGGRLLGLADLALGTLEAGRLLRRLRPAAAVGFGGYASFPAMLAATLARVPSVIHEQNAVLGRANRWLAARVDRIATSFESVAAIEDHDRAKVVRTGNPVRPQIAALATKPFPEVGAGSRLRLLVLGGSQGASVFSRVVPKAIMRLPEDLRRRLDISQQCRSDDLEGVRRTYDEAGIAADLASFFDDVAERLAAAHLVICRAGASTVAEITAAGRGAILVPYPRATDDHQTANARAVATTGGGWLIPESAFTPETLAERLDELLGRPATLAEAALKARRAGIPDAAARLAEVVLALLSPGDTARANAWEPAA